MDINQVSQLISWFMVLLGFLGGLYCLVLNFGGVLNRFVFLVSIVFALRHTALALLLAPPDEVWLNGLTFLNLEMSALLNPMQLIITLLLLWPNWWQEQFRWLIRMVAGLSLVLPILIIFDFIGETRVYYRGLASNYASDYMASEMIIPGPLFNLLQITNVVPPQLIIFCLALYIVVGGMRTDAITRKMALYILATFSIFLLVRILPGSLSTELFQTMVIVTIGAICYLAAIFLKIFSNPIFHRGSLQARLLNVVIATSIPILIAVGIFARLNNLAAFGSIALGSVMLVTFTWLTIRYSIRPIISLTQTASDIADGDLTRIAPIESEDEIGDLALAFNSMTRQLRELIDELEQRVADRTEALERRTVYLETSGLVGQHITAILNEDDLLHQVVDLLQRSFNYYFVSTWLFDEKTRQLALKANAIRSDEAMRLKAMTASLDKASIIGSTYKMGVYRLIGDIREAQDYAPDFCLPQTRSVLVLPLCVQEKTIGVLDIQSDELNTFEPDDVIIFQSLADKIAIAIRNAQLYDQEQRRRQLAEVLQETGRSLSSSLDLHEIPGLILEHLADVVPYERSALLLQKGRELEIIAYRGFPDDYRMADLRVPIRRGDIYQQIVGTSRPMRLDNVSNDPSWQQVDWLPLNLSWLGVPLVSKDRVIGMISLTHPKEAAFTDEDTELASAFASHATIALENAQLYDEITRLNEGLEQTVAERTDALHQAYQNLERLDKTKSDFIKVVAHELRTPLTVIKGYTQVLRNVRLADSPDAENRMLLDGVLSGVDRLRGIVDNMLDVTRLENEVLRVYKEETSLADIMEQVQRQFQTALEERQLTLTFDDLDNLPLIQADPDLMFKVFYHLLMNAIKYVPDGGAITVSGQTLRESEPDPTVEIIVSDTGIGIDPAHQDLIFEKFYQTGEMAVHSTGYTKYKGGGPGLGLAIVQGIILAHQGKIWVESQGHNEKTLPGSRFYVQLPLNGTG